MGLHYFLRTSLIFFSGSCKYLNQPPEDGFGAGLDNDEDGTSAGHNIGRASDGARTSAGQQSDTAGTSAGVPDSGMLASYPAQSSSRPASHFGLRFHFTFVVG